MVSVALVAASSVFFWLSPFSPLSQPNVGVGQLSTVHGKGPVFYTECGHRAAAQHSVVTVIGTVDEQSGLDRIGACASLSGGKIMSLDPLEAARQLRVVCWTLLLVKVKTIADSQDRNAQPLADAG